MLIPTAVTLTGTGCAQGFTGATPISSIDFPMSAVSFSDGALVEIEFMASESLSMLSGAFSFDAGPCMDREGAFILYRQ